MIIYKIEHKETGKVYIGQTSRSLKKRLREHTSPSNCVRLYRAICKYGWGSFTVEVIDSTDNRSTLNLLEEAWIQAYNSLSPNGYNLTMGGYKGEYSDESKAKMRAMKLGKPQSIEQRKKTSESLRGNKRALGLHHTEESKDKMRAKLKGKPLTEEHRAKISAAKFKYWENKRKAKEMEKP